MERGRVRLKHAGSGGRELPDLLTGGNVRFLFATGMNRELSHLVISGLRTSTVVIVLTSQLLLLPPYAMAADAAANQAYPPAPPAAQILEKLNRPHPRLLATEKDFARLKESIATDPQLKKWHPMVLKEAQNILQQAPSKYEIPDGLRLLATSRRVMNRIYTLAWCYRMEGGKQYLDRAWQELETAAQFPDWNPRHFLDTAEMTHAFAIAYDWLYYGWTDEQRQTLRQAIVEKGFTPGLKIYRAHSGWSAARHNWNQVCNGGMGIGALALAEVEPGLCGEILNASLVSLPRAMQEFAPDGAWAEGPGYWNYATAYNVVFLAACQTALGTDFGLSRMQGFSDTGLFPLYLSGPFGRTFNYADGGDRAVRAPQMFWLAQQFHQPVYAWYETQHASPAAQDLLWYQPAEVGPKAANLPLDKHFRNAEIVEFRSEWENSKALFVGFKAGDNKANHSHLDLGSFVFDALGARWAVDLGADDYNLPGYFGGKRWDYYRLRAEGQNTLVINPGKAPDQDPKADTRIVRFDTKPQKAFAIADLTPAYKEHARRVWRGLAMFDRNRVLVQDEIQAANPADVWWFMHTAAAIKIEQEGRTAILSQAGAEFCAELLSPAGVKFEMMDAAPLPSSPQPEKQAKNQGTRKLAIHATKVTDARIAVLLSPEPAQETKLTPLAEW